MARLLAVILALILVANVSLARPQEDPVVLEADLTIEVNGEKAILVCGDPTGVEGRRKSKGKQIPLHEAPEDACATLAHVDDLQNELKPPPPGSDPCINEEQEPEVVKIEGRFKGSKVNFKRSFRNKCQLQAVAPELFDIKGEGPNEPNEAQGRKKGKGGNNAWVGVAGR